jgi:hypothetical protein
MQATDTAPPQRPPSRPELATATPLPAAPPPVATPQAPVQAADTASPQPPPISAPPAATPAPAPPPTPTLAPPAAPPAEPPQREAIAIPPTAPPQPAPSPLELARAAAVALPCSVLNVADTQDGMRVSGIAPTGQDLDRLLAGMHDAGPVGDAVTRIDRIACAPIATLGAFVRRTWDSAPPLVSVRPDQRSVASGARLGIDVATSLPAVYVDLYQGDGSVRHLLRPPASGAAARSHADWIATPPQGARVVVAIAAAAPLDLAARPEIERAADYLAALQPALQRAPESPAVDLAMVMVRAAEPLAKPLQPRTTSLRSAKCANIVSRAQLGETLTDAELAALRTECRS